MEYVAWRHRFKWRLKRVGAVASTPVGAFAAGVALSLLLGGAFLLVVWLAGGLRTSGKYLDWNLVAALATVVTAVAALGALAAIGYGLEQLRASRRAERLSLMPYLRVDVGFEEEHARGRGSASVIGGRVLEGTELGGSIDIGGLSMLEPSPGDSTLRLAIWVRNLQTAPLGTAYQVEVGLYVAWRDEAGQALPHVAQVVVRLPYVEAGSTAGIRLAPVRATVSELTASVSSVSYFGMYLDRELLNRHGSLTMYYDGEQREVHNVRAFGLHEVS